MVCRIQAKRSSVCMGDDVNAPNASDFMMEETRHVSDLMECMARYVPEMRNVVWTVECDSVILGHLISDERPGYRYELAVPDTTVSELPCTEVFCRYWYAVRDYSVTPSRDLFPECGTLLEKVKAMEEENRNRQINSDMAVPRELTVRRKSAMANFLMPYWIIISKVTKAEFMQSHGMSGDLGKTDSLGYSERRIDLAELDEIGTRIDNGKEVRVTIPEDAQSVFLSTMDGNLSNEVPAAELEGKILLVTTKGGFAKPGYPHIETADA